MHFSQNMKMGIIYCWASHTQFLRVGMGINYSEVIKVIHVRPPDDCSDYIQQCGRASCRGEAASARNEDVLFITSWLQKK